MTTLQNDDLLPVVTQTEFDKIECNRCGNCCEGLWLHKDAVDDANSEHPKRHYADKIFLNDTQRMISWMQDLVPLSDEIHNGQMQYRCSRFARDENGLGVCTRYDERPWTCSGFPYGRPMVAPGFEQCSWRVKVVPDVTE